VYYAKDLQLKEAQQKPQTFRAQAGAMFSSVKGYRRTVGGSDKNVFRTGALKGSKQSILSREIRMILKDLQSRQLSRKNFWKLS
jgi:hypothetical protein